MNTGDVVMLMDMADDSRYYKHRDELINQIYVVDWDWGGVVMVLLRPLFIDVGHIARQGRLTFFRSSIHVLPLSCPPDDAPPTP